MMKKHAGDARFSHTALAFLARQAVHVATVLAELASLDHPLHQLQLEAEKIAFSLLNLSARRFRSQTPHGTVVQLPEIVVRIRIVE
jgi:hypothetical protein